jgi:hypothetical protein
MIEQHSTIVVEEEIQLPTAEAEPWKQVKFNKRYIVGVGVLLITVAIWVLDGEFIQFIYEDIEYDQPFFLTYTSTGLFSLYLLGFLFMPSWSCKDPKRGGKSFVNWSKEKCCQKESKRSANDIEEVRFASRSSSSGHGDKYDREEHSIEGESFYRKPSEEEEEEEVDNIPLKTSSDGSSGEKIERMTTWELVKVPLLFLQLSY